MTELLYLQYPNLWETSAVITTTSNDDKGAYLTFDRSLFYPQGGGQPSDQGEVFLDGNSYHIYDVRTINSEVRHYLTTEPPIKPTDNVVRMVIDGKRRMTNTRYHTAGHLIAAVAEQLFPEIRAIKGHQFPGEAYIKFNGTLEGGPSFIEKLQSAITSQIEDGIRVETKNLTSNEAQEVIAQLPYNLPEYESLRVCLIEGGTPVPCGGTHVSSLKELAGLVITQCKSKKGQTNIYYEIQNSSF